MTGLPTFLQLQSNADDSLKIAGKSSQMACKNDRHRLWAPLLVRQSFEKEIFPRWVRGHMLGLY